VRGERAQARAEPADEDDRPQGFAVVAVVAGAVVEVDLAVVVVAPAAVVEDAPAAVVPVAAVAGAEVTGVVVVVDPSLLICCTGAGLLS
jgi:hypothetical protein